MFIPTSNIFPGISPTITTGVGTDLPTNITSTDFSLVYVSSSKSFSAKFSVGNTMSYIAMSAANIQGATVSVTVDGVQEGSKTVERSNVLMFLFTRRVVNTIIITITGASDNPIISNVSGGDRRKIPNGGVTSGHKRQWLNRNQKNRTVTNLLGAPITSLVKRMPMRGTLNLPNMPNDFVQGYWQDFCDFVSTGRVFYLTEQEDFEFEDPEQSYACFNPTFSAPEAHSSTRALQNIKFGFSCYNGL